MKESRDASAVGTSERSLARLVLLRTKEWCARSSGGSELCPRVFRKAASCVWTGIRLGLRPGGFAWMRQPILAACGIP